MRLNQRDRVQAESLNLYDILPTFVAGLCQVEHVAPEIFLVEAPSSSVINFDRGHFEQVLWNLCQNALRYCSKHTQSVQLLVRKSAEGRIVLEITDDGPGVTPDDVQQLFEPFYTTATAGTGLGLYIARELSEANGAELEYVTHDQAGARFNIVFGETL
jgi:two-component system sensor histidine kinase PilS (NtrC family)